MATAKDARKPVTRKDGVPNCGGEKIPPFPKPRKGDGLNKDGVKKKKALQTASKAHQ